MFHTDVLIVGGGPAGLATGLALARQGVASVLCEKGAFPVDKACGEGLMPTGLALLRDLGVHLEGGYPFRGICYRQADSPLWAQADFREGPGRAVRRLDLSRALVSAAQGQLDLRPQTAVKLLERTPAGVKVELNGEPGLARLVVGADGLHSGIRRWAGLGRATRALQRWGLRQHFTLPPWSEHVEVTYAKGREAYVSPVGPNELCLSILFSPKGTRSPGPTTMETLLASFPELQDRLRLAPASSKARGAGPLRQAVARVTAPGIVLVGDAAGYVDACTGEGLSLAFEQALAVVQRVKPALKGSGLALLAGGYAQDHARITRNYKLLTSLALWASQSCWLQQGLIRWLARDPGLFQDLLSANMGNLRLSDLVWRALRSLVVSSLWQSKRPA